MLAAALAVGIVTGLAGPASAEPSFDCATAKTIREKAVCRDPRLARLDTEIAKAYATALARLDGLEVNEKSLADYFVKRLADDTTPPAQRAMLLRQVPVSHGKLTVELLTKLLAEDDAGLKLEAVRALPDTGEAELGLDEVHP